MLFVWLIWICMGCLFWFLSPSSIWAIFQVDVVTKMTSNVQLWVGKRKSEGTLSDLREVMVSGGYHWAVEDHGYNIGALVLKMCLHVFFLHVMVLVFFCLDWGQYCFVSVDPSLVTDVLTLLTASGYDARQRHVSWFLISFACFFCKIFFGVLRFMHLHVVPSPPTSRIFRCHHQ